MLIFVCVLATIIFLLNIATNLVGYVRHRRVIKYHTDVINAGVLGEQELRKYAAQMREVPLVVGKGET